MKIEEDNLLITYNPTEAISNNVTIEAIQEGPNEAKESLDNIFSFSNYSNF